MGTYFFIFGVTLVLIGCLFFYLNYVCNSEDSPTILERIIVFGLILFIAFLVIANQMMYVSQ